MLLGVATEAGARHLPDIPIWHNTIRALMDTHASISAQAHRAAHRMTSMLDEHYLTIAQAAERLHVNKPTIRRWIAQGTLPAYKVGQRRVALRAADLARLITPVRRTQEPGEGMQETELGISPRLTPEQQRQGLAALEAA